VVTSIFNSFLSYLVIWYNQGREEISSITQTLQSREFGEITMAKNAFAAGTPPPHTLPYSTPSALWSATRRIGSPLLCSPKISLNYTLAWITIWIGL